MKLSIIIPVYNEENTIVQVVQRVLSQSIEPWQKEIIIVNDGSADSTLEKINNFVGVCQPSGVFVFNPIHQGKGAAIRMGIKKATGDAIIIQDADLEYSPADWPRILEEWDKSGAAVVYGSRELSPERRGYSHFVLGVKFLTFLVNLFFGSELTDIYTGYKLFPTPLVKSLPLQSNGFEVEAEITVKLLKRGVKIKEVPISYNPRKFRQGKKIRWEDGVIGLWTIIKFYFKK